MPAYSFSLLAFEIRCMYQPTKGTFGGVHWQDRFTKQCVENSRFDGWQSCLELIVCNQN